MIKAGVVGWPIEQSKSPIIHNYWLDKYNINGSYKKISLSPENFKLGIKRLINDGYAGLNITVPHKEMALEISSNPTERAKKKSVRQIHLYLIKVKFMLITQME